MNAEQRISQRNHLPGESRWPRNGSWPAREAWSTLFESGSLGSQSDRDLLECFQTDSGPIGQEAFRILVERHGPMVLGLCRSLVRDQHEAEDAFQATFLVLVRKADSIRRRDTLGPWLHGVAAKVARRARSRLNDRRARESPVRADVAARERASPDNFSTEQLVHEEISRLPDSFRKPLVLCCLQGMSYDLAAQQLGVHTTTLRGRLERAQKRLSARLKQRGASVCARRTGHRLRPRRPGRGSPETGRIHGSVRDVLVADGGPARWRLARSQSISVLAQGVIHSMLVQSVRVSAIAVLAAAAIGTVVLAQQGQDRAGWRLADGDCAGRRPQGRPAGGPRGRRTRRRAGLNTSLDQPDGYVTFVDYDTKEVLVSITASMGAHPRMKMTIMDPHSPFIPTEKPKGSIELTSIGDTSSRARIIKTSNPADPIRVGDIVYTPAWSPNRPTRFALLGKIDVNRDGTDDRDELKRMIQEAGGSIDFDLPPPEVGKESGELGASTDWYVIDARLPLRRRLQRSGRSRYPRVGEVAKTARLLGVRPMPIERLLAYFGQEPNAQAPAPAATFNPPPGQSKDARIRQKLEMVIDADFPKDATLDTLLKHIRRVTTDATYTGIPIYVDPLGLAEANKTMAATVKLNYKQKPIRTILDFTLRPLGLAYEVRDGFLMISSRTAILEQRVQEIDSKLDRLIEMLNALVVPWHPGRRQ